MARKKGAVNSKKKTIDGITFASSLEAYCYERLKEAGLQFEYEGKKFELLPSAQYTGVYFKSVPKAKQMKSYQGKKVHPLTYTPDFFSSQHKFIIETKGYVPSQHTFPMRWKLFLHHLNENGMGDYKLFLPRNQEQVRDMITILTSHG